MAENQSRKYLLLPFLLNQHLILLYHHLLHLSTAIVTHTVKLNLLSELSEKKTETFILILKCQNFMIYHEILVFLTSIILKQPLINKL